MSIELKGAQSFWKSHKQSTTRTVSPGRITTGAELSTGKQPVMTPRPVIHTHAAHGLAENHCTHLTNIPAWRWKPKHVSTPNSSPFSRQAESKESQQTGLLRFNRVGGRMCVTTAVPDVHNVCHEKTVGYTAHEQTANGSLGQGRGPTRAGRFPVRRSGSSREASVFSPW